jgi:hypothetical protein
VQRGLASQHSKSKAIKKRANYHILSRYLTEKRDKGLKMSKRWQFSPPLESKKKGKSRVI